MAICKLCKQEMLEVDGCFDKKLYVLKTGEQMEALPYGIGEGGQDENGRCHDCGCLVGHYHHDRCDMEICPFCELQLISCVCDIEFVRLQILEGGE